MAVYLPTSYLPPVSYIREFLGTDAVVLEINETYRKQTIRNHCLIAGPNGKLQLTIPVIKVNGNHTKTKDIRISYSQDWQRSHWRSIETAYNKSPFFLYYRDYFEPFYLMKYDLLVEFNSKLLEVIFRILRINKEIMNSDSFLSQVEEHQQIHLPHYNQVFIDRHGFIPDLSIIDLIFNLGPQAGEHIG